MLKWIGKTVRGVVDYMEISIEGSEKCEQPNLAHYSGNDNAFRFEVDNEYPENEFGILNEQLLLLIFNTLDIVELCRMVDVCKTFKKIAMLSFTTRFKSFNYPEFLQYPDEKIQMRRVLSKFGHLIESLYVVELLTAAEWNAISKYCTGTLKELSLELYVPLICEQVDPLFGSLETLSLQYRDFKGNARALFQKCQKLKVLKVHFIAFTYRKLPEFVQRYPNLEEIYFLVDAPRVISSLLRLNPQIKKLEMLGYHADRTICTVASEMNNLEQLRLRGFSCVHSVHELNKLKSLKALELTDAFQSVPLKAVISAMQDYPLDCLKLEHVASSLGSVFSLKFLRKFKLCHIDIPFDNFITNWDESLPLLEEMELWFSHYAKSPLFTIDGIRNVIGSSKTLALLKIDTKEAIAFDQDAYDDLLEVFRKRSDGRMLTIKISGKNAEVEPISNDLLRIEFANNNCCYKCCKPGKSIRLSDREGYIHMIRFFGTHPPVCACGCANINTGTLLQRMVKNFVSIDLP